MIGGLNEVESAQYLAPSWVPEQPVSFPGLFGGTLSAVWTEIS